MKFSPAAPEPDDNRKLVRRLLALAWSYRAGCLKVLGIQTILLVMGLGGLAFIGLAIDLIRHSLDPATTPASWPMGFHPPEHWSAFQQVALVAGLILLVAVVRVSLNSYYTMTSARLVQDIIIELRTNIYDKLQQLSFRFYDSHSTGSIIQRATSDVQAVRMFVDGVVIQGFIIVLSLMVYLAYMVSVHLLLTLACLATTPILWMVSVRFSRIIQPLYTENLKLNDAMVTHLSESVAGVQAVKAFNREPEILDRFLNANRAIRDQQEGVFRKVSIYSPLVGFLTQLNLAILLLYGGWLFIQGSIPLGGGLIVFAALLQQFSGQVSNLAGLANTIQQSLAGARRVFEIIDAPVAVVDKPGALKPAQWHGGVVFDNVGFSHGPSGEPILENIGFQVPPGSCVAILGATGSGKSTMLNLIPRFYDVTSGSVRIDGHDVRDLDLQDLRRHIGMVFQETFLFSISVAANIGFGHPRATREQVIRAAKIACAHDFIMELPKGYDTVIGEYGATLSGGQRQRLAIARAVLLEPPILLLDDPTAAIDPETEEEILNAMEHATAGRTTFLVAHRLSTLRRADLILVLERGRLIQRGTHDELMEAPGPYRQAAAIQMLGRSGAIQPNLGLSP